MEVIKNMDWTNKDEIKNRVHSEMLKTSPKVDLEPPDLEHIEIPSSISSDKNWDKINFLKKIHKKNYDSKIESGEWVFNGDFRMAGKYGGSSDPCPRCECTWSRIILTPKSVHYAQLLCARCGYHHKFVKKPK